MYVCLDLDPRSLGGIHPYCMIVESLRFLSFTWFFILSCCATIHVLISWKSLYCVTRLVGKIGLGGLGEFQSVWRIFRECKNFNSCKKYEPHFKLCVSTLRFCSQQFGKYGQHIKKIGSSSFERNCSKYKLRDYVLFPSSTHWSI